jgi:hypothetical protein
MRGGKKRVWLKGPVVENGRAAEERRGSHDLSRGNRIVITTRRYSRPAGWARIMGPESVA